MCVFVFLHADSEVEVPSEATPLLEREKPEEQPGSSAVRTRTIPNNKRYDLLSTLHSIHKSIKISSEVLCFRLTLGSHNLPVSAPLAVYAVWQYESCAAC